MKRRLLIVSPHFPPSSTADMHRVRVLAPLLEKHGWEVHVLAVHPDQVAAPRDQWLLDGLPPELPVERVRTLGLGAARLPGLGTLGLRALPALERAGNRALAGGGFDMVYFSTTMFEVHVLGPRWKRKHGVPFAMDYQDLWVSDYYRERPGEVPPGGRLKYAAASTLHRWMEPRVLRACSGITSVSGDYPEILRRRYPEIFPLATLVQPFPASLRDMARIPPGPVPVGRTWLYVGRGGKDMHTALRGLFRALSERMPPSLRGNLRLRFVGTSYAAAGCGHATIAPLAAEYGLQDIVEESPDRITYSQALALIRSADALIVPGSDDPAYTASKIYPYLLADRPLLAIFHRNSSVVDLFESVGGGVCVRFEGGMDEHVLSGEIAERWLEGGRHEKTVPLDRLVFSRYGEDACAEELARFLHRCADGRA